MDDVGEDTSRRTRIQDCSLVRTQIACVRASAVSRSEGLARGYLSVTRWQAYAAPDAAFQWGGAGRAEAGRVGHNFQIYVQMFLSRARIGARSSWGRCLS